MPRKTNDPIGVRNFIKAPDGHIIVSCDYSQIELRVGAHYSHEEIIEVYKRQIDSIPERFREEVRVAVEAAEDAAE